MTYFLHTTVGFGGQFASIADLENAVLRLAPDSSFEIDEDGVYYRKPLWVKRWRLLFREETNWTIVKIGLCHKLIL
jgi:hypothetical protein